MNISTERLKVLGELLVDFNNLKDNGIDVLPTIRFQGWENFFNRFQGPVYFNMVKYFWIHAKSYSFQVISFVFGKKIVIYEKLIAKLIEHDRSKIICEQMVEKDSNITEISKVILSSGKHSSKIKDFLPHLKGFGLGFFLDALILV